MDLEELIRELVKTILDGQGIHSQAEFQNKENRVLTELENLKDELETYLLEAVEELPADDEESDEEDEESDSLSDLADEMEDD